MNILISLLITVLVLGLIWWALQQLPIPAPFRTVVTIIFVIVAIVALVSFLPMGPTRFWK